MIILLTGITGQDGGYMVDYLLQHHVDEIECIYGTYRKKQRQESEESKEKEDPPTFSHPKVCMIEMDLSVRKDIFRTIESLKPNFLFNFAGQSVVTESWTHPMHTMSTNAMGVMDLLEAIRLYAPECRFFSAGSSEEFGKVVYVPQDLDHPCHPLTPYGWSKLMARHCVTMYRELYNLYAVHCILYNHEGIYRRKNFVTRKITSHVAEIKKQWIEGRPFEPLLLGNIFSRRDWSDGQDFIRVIWKMMQQPLARNYLLSSNSTHTIKEFIDECFACASLDTEWVLDENDPLQNRLVLNPGGQVVAKIDPRFMRPVDPISMCGDSSKIWKEIDGNEDGVAPTSFRGLVRKMYQHDWDLLHPSTPP